MGHTLRISIPALLVSAFCACSAFAQSVLASTDRPGQAGTLALLTVPGLVSAGRSPVESSATATNWRGSTDDFASFLRDSHALTLRGAMLPIEPPAVAGGHGLRLPKPLRAMPATVRGDRQLRTAQDLFHAKNVAPCQDCGVRQKIVTGLLATPPRMRPAVPAAVVPNAAKHGAGGFAVNFVW